MDTTTLVGFFPIAIGDFVVVNARSRSVIYAYYPNGSSNTTRLEPYRWRRQQLRREKAEIQRVGEFSEEVCRRADDLFRLGSIVDVLVEVYCDLHDGKMVLPNTPPEGYQTPRFPSLNVQTLYDQTTDKRYTLYYILDVWRFTLLWTLIIYALFHLGAVLTAMFTHGWKKSSWRYLWAVPVIYLVVAGLEAVMAGSIVGLVLGAVYSAGYYEMNTWIPCTWGFINVLVLIISSFSIQGGL
ncbi:hypothetical protein HG531_011453 [Fusarium graminearum]|nr:hypothetical protein HG531_011453 [Fusarium graminearum]